MIILNGLLSFLAVIGSWHIEKRIKFYMALMLVLETGVMGVFASLDLFLFFLFWEVELIPMFLLIGIWGGARREYAAWKFLIYTLVGSAFMLAGIFLLYFQTGAHRRRLSSTSRRRGQSLVGTLPFFGGGPSRCALAIFLLLFVGFAVKMPMWPFHTWLPDAHTEAPTAVSVLLAGVLLKMGAYGLIRICLGFVPHGAHAVRPGARRPRRDQRALGRWRLDGQQRHEEDDRLLQRQPHGLRAAGRGRGCGGAATRRRSDFRQAALTGAALQMFTHGTITGMLFFCVGVIYDKAHTRDIDDFGGIAQAHADVMLLFSSPVSPRWACPALSGFVAEYLVFTGTFAPLPVPTISAAFGVVLTAGYLLWMLRRVFYGPLNLKWSWLTDATRARGVPAGGADGGDPLRRHLSQADRRPATARACTRC